MRPSQPTRLVLDAGTAVERSILCHLEPCAEWDAALCTAASRPEVHVHAYWKGGHANLLLALHVAAHGGCSQEQQQAMLFAR